MGIPVAIRLLTRDIYSGGQTSATVKWQISSTSVLCQTNTKQPSEYDGYASYNVTGIDVSSYTQFQPHWPAIRTVVPLPDDLTSGTVA